MNPARNQSDPQGDAIAIAYLIMACNEEMVIQKTILSLKKAMLPADALFVVADNCDDQTANGAKANGAVVLLRENRSSPGKSAALVWVIHQHAALIQPFNYVVILDADSIVSENFSFELRKNINKTDQALQCRLAPSEFESSPISTLSALSEIIEQTIFQRLRTLLGL
ncbi:MAG: glycosyltransferase, partial [Anaerolineaceae bacterium]|nr:glycosyltransferase [Anaerolineaceae bacterium]